MAPGGADPKERRRRNRESWLVVLGRPALFVAWVGAFWGTLIAFSLVVSAMEVGLREALSRLLPPGRTTAWDYVNAGSVLLALAAWTLAATALIANRGDRAAP
ncbi:MAG: hypothetical protein ACHQKZ_06355 [Solirubrobacterales bacterium]